ncbi:S8 family peptidase [Kitasatospora sp. NPDC050543]|uniref:S8 family peptidase n=1 Tax=Kitasatospora sp. NPDC050543 TaxID=3364054 RepID=UPI0037AF7EA7
MRLSARRTSAALLLIVPLAAAPAAAATGSPSPQRASPAPLHRSANAVPGQYIVTLKKDVDPAATAQQALPGVEPLFTYSSVLNGFAAQLTPDQLTAVRNLPDVEAVEEDGVASATPATETAPTTARGRRVAAASWGLDRIDQPYLPLNQQFNVAGTGKGATVYVVDTGIDYAHSEFGGRAAFGYDAMSDGRKGADCNGHGTHVAGTVGGANYGVAREASLVSVRVLGCDGRGTWSGIIAGLDWVGQNAKAGSVLNGSLGGSKNLAVNAAANAVSDKGVVPAIAAGNDAVDACGVSPASAERVVTVGATDRFDQETDFSNYGTCLRLYAPGKAIVSAKLGGGGTALDGTSMASPHVAGVAALYKAKNPNASSEQVATWLAEQATKDVLKVSKGSPNLLLHTGGL